MTLQSKTLKRVGTNSSPFDFRLICRPSELTLKSFGAEKYLSALNKFTRYILKNKEIPPQKMLLHFDIWHRIDFTQFCDSLSLISGLPSYKFLSATSTKGLNQKYSDAVADCFDLISVHIKRVSDLIGAEILIDAAQEKYDVKYHLNLDVTSFENIELVVKFIERVKKKKYYDISISGDQKKIKNGLDHILAGERYLGNAVRNKDHHIYGHNEMCILEDDSISSLDEAGFLQQPYQTKNLTCEMGVSYMAIDPVGRIKTSFCPQADEIGVLFWPQTYQNNLPIAPYECKQDSCQDFFDRLIKKGPPGK